jgi:hypothetical protein
MANNWINFVKEFSAKKSMKYTDALKSAECKEAYNKQKPKSMDDMKNSTKIMIKAKKTIVDMDEKVMKPFEIPVEPVVKVKKPRAKKMMPDL